MEEKYIVRADFYPSGRVIPLGLTDDKGNSIYVQKIKKAISLNSYEYKLECVIDEKNFVLVLKNNKWTCFKVE